MESMEGKRKQTEKKRSMKEKNGRLRKIKRNKYWSHDERKGKKKNMGQEKVGVRGNKMG